MEKSIQESDASENELLGEMARVGCFGNEYEVYVNTDDPGDEPHFHVRDATTQGREFHTCVKIKEAMYFRHPGKMDVMSALVKKALVDFLKAAPPPRKRVLFTTNWEKVIYEWNENNSRMNVDEDQPMPDYIHIDEDMNLDHGTIIGTFSTGTGSVNEVGSVRRITHPHQYIVFVHPNEGEMPHFHVFDKPGMHRTQTHKDGFHTCIEIRTNKYFKHGVYTDNLDQKSRKALDEFMNEIRESPKYRSDIGCTNFEHTINEWDDNNAQEGENIKKFVNPDPDVTPKPDYTTLIDNLK